MKESNQNENTYCVYRTVFHTFSMMHPHFLSCVLLLKLIRKPVGFALLQANV